MKHMVNESQYEMPRILIIEDERDLAEGLQGNLELEGHSVSVALSGEAGLESVRHDPPELMILDLMLPDMDGYRVLHELRRAGHDFPVLLLTALGEETDKVRGLRLGADDHVTKPFGILEIIARIDALLRRATPGSMARETYRVGSVEVDVAARTVHQDGQPVELAPREFDLLVALCRRNGAAASRQELMREVWGHQSEVVSRTVDTHVAELRRKLEPEPARPRHIVTVRKLGYRLGC